MMYLINFTLIFFIILPAHATQSFQDALAHAWQTNPSLSSERAKVKAAETHIDQAASGYRPDIYAVGDVGKSQTEIDDPSYSDLPTHTPRTLSLNITQPIFRGFRTSAQVSSAKATALAAYAGYENAEQHLLLEAAKAYLGVILTSRILLLNRENEGILQHQLEMTTDRFRVGELKRTDVSQAESRLKAATVSRIQAEAQEAFSRTTYYRVIGLTSGELDMPTLEFKIPTSLDEALAIALHAHPSIRSAQYAHDAAKEDITAAKGGLFPQIDIIGSASRAWEQNATLPQKQDSASIIARVTIPFYRTGSDYAKTDEAHHTATQKRLDLESLRNQIREETNHAWQNLLTSRMTVSGRRDVVKAMMNALDGVREESKVGTRTTWDVLNAEEDLLQAKIDEAHAISEEALALMELKAALGQLTANDLNLPVKSPDK